MNKQKDMEEEEELALIAEESTDATGMDTDRFSRIIAFIGAGTLKQLMSLKVLICGLDGLGAEIAKNLILSGVGTVTLHDTAVASWTDLSSHFYLSESDLGKNRAECCVSQLRELNPYTTVKVHTEKLTTAFIGEFQAVVMVNWPSQQELLEISDFCHYQGHHPDNVSLRESLDLYTRLRPAEQVQQLQQQQLQHSQQHQQQQQRKIVFVKADARGLFSSIFSDFGPTHIVMDKNGEEPRQAIVVSITNSKPAIITTHDEKPHGLSVGDYVHFEEVLGMTEINSPPEKRFFKVIGIKGLYGFEIELDSTDFGVYTGGGVVNEVKVQLAMKSRSYREALEHPGEFLLSDFAKLSRAGQLHFGFQALLEYQKRHYGQLPESWNKEHAAEVVSIVKELNERATKRDEPIKKRNEVYQEEYDKEMLVYNEAKKLFDEAKEAVKKAEGEANEIAALLLVPSEPIKPTLHLEPRIFFLEEEIDEDLISKLAYTARGNLNPLAAFVGGVVAQEVLKSTGKYHPIHQWFYFDSTEALPQHFVTDAQPLGCRYDGQIAVFGKSFQEKLFDTSVFLVGAGALGCEFLKNFSLMGVSAGKEGKGEFFLTDMDNIEKSNLSRQFLFRDSDLQKMKSVCAARAAKAMNPEFRITSSVEPVGESTEHIFDDTFWKSKDIIVNALDNVKSRLYVDSQCVKYLKPLLESGTLGTKANSQIILPHLTESYGSSVDPPDPSIPLCTLKNFPHQIEHTIEWARDKFQGLFTNSFEDANRLINNSEEFMNSLKQVEATTVQLARLKNVDEILNVYNYGKVTMKECVIWARQQFQEMFHNTVAQLLFNFPEDALTTAGTPFWSGPKRPPVPAVFDVTNETHLDFIVSTANLLAFSLRIPQEKDAKKIAELVADVAVEPFVPKSGIRIKKGEDDNVEEGGEDDDVELKRLMNKLSNIDKSLFTFPEKEENDNGNNGNNNNNKLFEPSHFEKDDDKNFHVAFMTSTSNLRAANYRIRPADFQKTKKIAGRIIPAIATTTAMITGLVAVEFYKVALHSEKNLESFRNSYINLALPSFVQSEPMPCTKHLNSSNNSSKSDIFGQVVKYYPDGWTLWDRFLIDEGDITFQQLVDYFKDKHNLVLTSVSSGESFAYNSFQQAMQERLPLVISEWVRTSARGYTIKPTDKVIDVVVLCEDEEGTEIEIPHPVQIKFR